MPKITYETRDFSESKLAVIKWATQICESYSAQGYSLTLRQLYYQGVSRGWIPNKDTEYKRLGGIVAEARLAGLIDWEHLEDRTRNVRENPHWDSPRDIMRAAAQSFAVDKWEGQQNRVEVWIEKDALVGVIENVCRTNDVPFFSCRGYTSLSEVWRAARRLEATLDQGQTPVILHLGDHDPSGIDMTRDIHARLETFLVGDGYDPAEVKRLALNWDQVEQYDPPPNPAKLTDSRVTGYIEKFGESSWELDALDPPVIEALVQDAIDDIRDPELWDAKVEEEATQRQLLTKAASRWTSVAAALESGSV